jgi:phospholipase A-2-activating protein
VRCISTGPVGEIISGGQDAFLKRWLLGSDASSAAADLLGPPLPHSHWVVATTQILPGELPAYPAGGIVTGCQDGIIRVFNVMDGTVSELIGHEKGVISFSWTSDRRLVSGSWDGTARVWDMSTGACTKVFPGHENGVHVLSLPNGVLATVSTGESVNSKPANFKLRLWNISTGSLLSEPIMDHLGSLRAVFNLPEVGGFATTSNDGSIILRDNSGAPFESVFHDPQDDGSSPFILDGTALQPAADAMCIDSSTGTLAALRYVTCGEDGSVVVWQGTERLAILPHACSVWCVVALPGGDFATGGHDGMIRVFSANADKTGTPEAAGLHDQFEAETAAAVDKRRQGKGPSAEELAKAPHWDDRFNRAGTSEGQVCVFRKETKAIAAQWSAASQAWVEIGDVVGGAGSKETLDGVEYDYVLSVEMETPNGIADLKLGCNSGENPFTAAQRFIDANSLGNQHLNQIADFIIAQTSLKAPTFDLSAGGGAASSAPQAFVGNPTAPPPAPARGLKHVPSETYSVFAEVPTASKVLNKLTEFNSDPSNTNALSPTDMENLSNLLGTLERTSYYHASVISKGQAAAMLKLRTWGDVGKGGVAARLFLCLDLCRATANHPSGAEVLAKVDKSLLTAVVDDAVTRILSQDYPLTANGTDANVLTAMRMCCNFFKNEYLRAYIVGGGVGDSPLDKILQISDARLGALMGSSKAMRIACSSLLLNLNIFLGPLTRGVVGHTKMEAMTKSCSLLFSFLIHEKESADVVSRIVFALGTAYYYDDARTVATRDQFLGVITAIRSDPAKAFLLSGIALECVNDISTLLL